MTTDLCPLRLREDVSPIVVVLLECIVEQLLHKRILTDAPAVPRGDSCALDDF